MDIDKANGDEKLTITGEKDDSVNKTDDSKWTKTDGAPDQYSTTVTNESTNTTETVIIKIDQDITNNLV